MTNANSIVQHVTQVKNGIKKHVNVNLKTIVTAKKIMVGIVGHVFVRIASIADTIIIMDTREIKKVNTIAKKIRYNFNKLL